MYQVRIIFILDHRRWHCTLLQISSFWLVSDRRSNALGYLPAEVTKYRLCSCTSFTAAICKCLNPLPINFDFLTGRLVFHPWLVLVYLQVLACTGHGYIQKHEDLKGKMYSCNASIYFNKKCLFKNLISNYARIKIQNTFPTSKFTQQIIAGCVLYRLHILISTGVTWCV